MLLQHYGAAVLVAAEQLPEQLRHGRAVEASCRRPLPVPATAAPHSLCPIGDQRPAAHSLGSTTVFRAGCGGTKSLFHACGTPAPRVSRPGWSTGTNGGSPAPPRPARPRAAS